jgi:hypothetical protein
MANGGKQKRSGWHVQAEMNCGVIPIWGVPDGPSRWDLLLRDLGMTDAAAVLTLMADPKSAAAAQLRSFARQNRHRAFVPEVVLEALGLPMSTGDLDDRRLW